MRRGGGGGGRGRREGEGGGGRCARGGGSGSGILVECDGRDQNVIGNSARHIQQRQRRRRRRARAICGVHIDNDLNVPRVVGIALCERRDTRRGREENADGIGSGRIRHSEVVSGIEQVESGRHLRRSRYEVDGGGGHTGGGQAGTGPQNGLIRGQRTPRNS
jgi:hypothetical protein